jgi:Single-strand binding protein family
LATQVIIVETTKTCDAVRRHGQVRVEKASKSERHHTTIVGNLVDDPELRFTNNGTAVANLRVAVTQRTSRTASGATATPRPCGSTSGAARPSTWPTPWPRGTG